MLENLLFAFVGAVFGVALGGIPTTYRYLQTIRRQRKRSQMTDLSESGQVSAWLVKYYQQHQAPLFNCQIGSATRTIPFLTQGSWVEQVPLDLLDKPLVEELDEVATNEKVDESALNRRRNLGAVLFKSWRKSLRFAYIDTNERPLKVRPCEYFEIASFLIRLEEETLASVKSRRSRSTPLRDAHLSGFPLIGQEQTAPFSVGCHVVVALEDDRATQILVQTRASTVITYPGTRAVIPNFGLEPNAYGGITSRRPLIIYNVVREYLEELFDYEEIIGRTTWSRDPDHIFRLPEGRTLSDAISNGTVRVSYLGAGVECLSGTFTLAVLMRVRAPEVIRELEERLRPNYEVAEASTSVIPVELVPVDDQRFPEWLRMNRLQPSSAFALSLALKALTTE